MISAHVLPLIEARQAGFQTGKEHTARDWGEDVVSSGFAAADAWLYGVYLTDDEARKVFKSNVMPFTPAERMTIYVAFNRGYLDGINAIHVGKY